MPSSDNLNGKQEIDATHDNYANVYSNASNPCFSMVWCTVCAKGLLPLGRVQIQNQYSRGVS